MKSWKHHFRLSREVILKAAIKGAHKVNMEQEPKKTRQQLEQRYQQLAFQVGNLMYQQKCLEDQVEVFFKEMLSLNQEGAQLAKEEQENGTNPNSSIPIQDPAPAEAPTSPEASEVSNG